MSFFSFFLSLIPLLCPSILFSSFPSLFIFQLLPTINCLFFLQSSTLFSLNPSCSSLSYLVYYFSWSSSQPQFSFLSSFPIISPNFSVIFPQTSSFLTSHSMTTIFLLSFLSVFQLLFFSLLYYISYSLFFHRFIFPSSSSFLQLREAKSVSNLMCTVGRRGTVICRCTLSRPFAILRVAQAVL